MVSRRRFEGEGEDERYVSGRTEDAAGHVECDVGLGRVRIGLRKQQPQMASIQGDPRDGVSDRRRSRNEDGQERERHRVMQGTLMRRTEL